MTAASASSTAKAYDLQIKLLMIGDSGVGKTCLLLRYTNDSFSPTFITTIGIDFKVKTVKVEDKTVKLQVWDTAGQERFRTITTSYFRGAQGIVLVYDVTDRSSFENVKTWMGQIQQYADLNVNKVLVANKCDTDATDSPQKRVVSTEEGKKLAKEFGLELFEASAKTNLNVSEAFTTISKQVVKRLNTENTLKVTKKDDKTTGKVNLESSQKKSNFSNCCNQS